MSLIALLIVALGLSGCATTGITTQHQKIATACESAASAADAIAAGVKSGRVTKAQLARATAVYSATVPACEPAPAESLDAVKYAALAAAVAELAAMQGALK